MTTPLLVGVVVADEQDTLVGERERLTDLLSSAPSVAMDDFAAAYDLDHREVPFEMTPMKLWLLRNTAKGDEPGVRWFLDRIAAAFGDPNLPPESE